jgi:hypothetical protein
VKAFCTVESQAVFAKPINIITRRARVGYERASEKVLDIAL